MEDSYNPEEDKINQQVQQRFLIIIYKSQGDLMTLTCFSQTPDNYSSQSRNYKKGQRKLKCTDEE